MHEQKAISIQLITMSPAVIKHHRTLVRPSQDTPSGNLPLSSVEKLPHYRRLVDMVHVFKHGCLQPSKVIREALSKALNHYYPLAGRLVESEDGDLEVACTAQGAWFVEASADCSLKDVNFLKVPLMISAEDIRPHPRPGVDPEGAIVMIQVTEFTCGGFAVVYAVNHVASDGIGYAQFLKAVGEMARGLILPTVPPIWSTESIIPRMRLPQPSKPPAILSKGSMFEYSVIDVSLDSINQLKKQFTSETGGRCCTSFQVLGTILWQCWSRASCHSPQQLVEFGFPVNLRPVLLPRGVVQVGGGGGGGYYGNCMGMATAKAPIEKISSASIAEVVDLIRDAKERVPPVELRSWSRGQLKVDDPGPLLNQRINDGFLVVMDWRRLGYYEVDYGWGAPIHFAPLSVSNTTHSKFFCCILKPPTPMQGARLLTQAVTKEMLTSFLLEKTTMQSAPSVNPPSDPCISRRTPAPKVGARL